MCGCVCVRYVIGVCVWGGLWACGSGVCCVCFGGGGVCVSLCVCVM